MWVDKDSNKVPQLGGKEVAPKAKPKKVKQEVNGKLESKD